MARYLVAYYSFSGNTAQVAEALAAELDADIDRIVEPNPRGVAAHFFRSLFELLFGLAPAIAPPVKNPGDYDVVILGSPVWAGTMASPMRSYLLWARGRVRRAAYLVTAGGSGADRAIAKMANMLESPPLASLTVLEPDLRANAWREKTAAFAHELTEAASRSNRPAALP